MNRLRLVALVFWSVANSLLIAAAAADDSWRPAKELQQAAAKIDEAVLRAHIRFLADDLLEGRGPGSRGDALTQRYIIAQFELLGLSPAAPGGGWRQRTPLVGVKTHCPPIITFKRRKRSLKLKFYEDYIAVSGRPQSKVGFRDAQLVFVGYGIEAPEYDWDDYKGMDVKGKVLLMMNNDPSDDPRLFAGRRRLYYGRWDYKYQMAAKKGAAGAIIIHTTPSAGYPYQVVQTSWTGEEFELADTRGPRVEMEGWVTEQAAKKIAALSGNDLDKMRAAAKSRDFRPIPLGCTLSMSLTTTVRRKETANVMGILPGADAKLRKELVIYMAHHDHIGIAAERDERGDNIYNGAVDNASGTAALLALARAYAGLPKPPRRSILFAAVGAEEQGLLGSEYFAAHPPAPAGYLAAVLNMDGLNTFGRTRDVNVIGLGKSNMDEHVQAVAAWQGRVVTPDLFPDRGYYYRSDQFSLAKIGVPGVYLHPGVSVIGKPEGWGRRQREQWIEKHYHQPSDEYRSDWDLSGAVEDVRLLFYAGYRAAQNNDLPTWTPGDEFEAARKAALAARK